MMPWLSVRVQAYDCSNEIDADYEWGVQEEAACSRRDRSMSDVDQLPEDMGVLWVSDGGTLLQPIVIDVVQCPPSAIFYFCIHTH